MTLEEEEHKKARDSLSLKLATLTRKTSFLESRAVEYKKRPELLGNLWRLCKRLSTTSDSWKAFLRTHLDEVIKNVAEHNRDLAVAALEDLGSEIEVPALDHHACEVCV